MNYFLSSLFHIYNYDFSLSLYLCLSPSFFVSTSFFLFVSFFYMTFIHYLSVVPQRSNKAVPWIDPFAHLPRIALLPVYFPVFPSGLPTILFTWLLLVINFASDKRLGLVDILDNQREPDGNKTLHIERESETETERERGPQDALYAA
jgi:hypothetical protein